MVAPNSTAENVLGTIGTVCWTIQLIPQVWKSWRTKSTAGLSHWLVLLWGISGGFLGVYVIVENLNIPLILQPQLFAFLSLVSWGQCQYYELKRSRNVAILLAVSIMLLVGGLEASMVFAIRPSYNNGNIRGVQFFGIFSSILLSAALLPQYHEIFKRKEVVGISIAFMLIDILGGIFSDLSLMFKEEFDIIAGVAYSLVVVLDAVIVVAAIILNPRAKRRRRLDAEMEALDGNLTPASTAPVTRVPTPTISSYREAEKIEPEPTWVPTVQAEGGGKDDVKQSLPGD